MSRFRRRLMGLSALRQAKADDFVRVEYIENSNLAYINTNFSISTNNGYSIDAVITISSAKQGYLIGKSAGNPYNASIGISANPYFRTYCNRTAINYTEYTAELDKKYHLIGSPQELTVEYEDIDEETQETVTKSFTFENSGSIVNSKQLSIFNIIGYVNNSNAFYGRIYSFKLYSHSGTLVRDFIPMYQISTDTYGLWDRVNEEFYGSANSYKFTGGERVIADANDNLYYFRNYIVIQNSAKQCSIGIQPNATDYFETKVYLAGSARNYFCGGWSGNNNNAYGARAMNNTLYFEYGTGAISFAPVGGFTNKIFTYKSIFNDTEQKMHFYIFDANNKQLWTNSIAKRGGTSSRAFLLGKLNGSTYGANTNSRMYYFKYWRNQELVRDMIPVQSVETGKYGFFDKVNLRIYYSSGSQDFTGA